MDTVRVLRSEGIPAVYGDARHLETLTNAGIATARGLIITVAGMTAVEAGPPGQPFSSNSGAYGVSPRA